MHTTLHDGVSARGGANLRHPREANQLIKHPIIHLGAGGHGRKSLLYSEFFESPEFGAANKIIYTILLRSQIRYMGQSRQPVSILVDINRLVYNGEVVMLELKRLAGQTALRIFNLLKPL